MNDQQFQALQTKANQIFGEYETNYAGKPRATRNLSRLDELIERLDGVVEEAKKLRNGGRNQVLSDFLEQARENLEIYRSEREAIQQVKSGGKPVVESANLATWANIQFHRYRRHFANESRATRDLGLFDELIAELEGIRDRMQSLLEEGGNPESLEQDLETVEQNLEMYRSERERVAEARQSGTLEEQASNLAVAANEQFSVYNDLFAGKDRLSRRPELISRVIRNLETIQNEMKSLVDQGFDSDQNQTNIDIVDRNLEVYRDERDEIREAREAVPAREIAGHLGGAANQAFQEYKDNFAGQSRSTRDLSQLGRICDELYHVAWQMRALEAEHDLQNNGENLGVVLENLTVYQREYDQVAEAQESGDQMQSR